MSDIDRQRTGHGLSAGDEAWENYRARFSDVYDDSNYSRSLQSGIMAAGHRLVEASFGADARFENVLEVGAGTGQHLDFVRHGFSQYTLADNDPSVLALASERLRGKHEGRLMFSCQEAGRLDFPDNTFDRLIATHVWEHVQEPYAVLKEWGRVLKNGGTLSVLIPSDPGLLWRIGRMLGPRRQAQARGIPYDFIMAREHVNSSNNLVAIFRYCFGDEGEAWWPLRVRSIDLNLFISLQARVVK